MKKILEIGFKIRFEIIFFGVLNGMVNVKRIGFISW